MLFDFSCSETFRLYEHYLETGELLPVPKTDLDIWLDEAMKKIEQRHREMGQFVTLQEGKQTIPERRIMDTINQMKAEIKYLNKKLMVSHQKKDSL